MKPSSVRINVAASTKTLDVDNRISLRYYFRIADNILKQANIFRAEKNYIDLYIMLLRFASLVTETIPRHRDYRESSQAGKNYLKKKSLEAVIELESLKPTVERKIDELSRKHTHHIRGHQNNSLDSSHEWLSIKKLNSNTYVNIKIPDSEAFEAQHDREMLGIEDDPIEEYLVEAGDVPLAPAPLSPGAAQSRPDGVVWKDIHMIPLPPVVPPSPPLRPVPSEDQFEEMTLAPSDSELEPLDTSSPPSLAVTSSRDC